VKPKIFFLFIICIAIFSVQLVFSQEIVFFGSKSGTIFISPRMEVFEDIHSELTIKKIINDSLRFSKSKQQVPNYSFTKSTIWCRFEVKIKSTEDCYLEISPSILNEIICYQVFENKVDSTVLGSLYTNVHNNAFESNNYIFKLNSEAKYYVLKIRSKARLYINAYIQSFDSLVEKTNANDSLQFMYAGLLLMIFIYNLFLFFSTREKIFLYYLLHLLNTLIFFLYISGYGIEFIWSDYPVINSYFLAIICFGFLFTIYFVLEFLETKKNLRFIHYSLLVMMILLAIAGIANLLGNSYYVGRIMNYIGFPIILLIIIGAINLARKGFKPAITFLIAWFIYLLGIAIQTLQSLNYLPTSDFTSNSIQIGSAFEIILLSLAVGNKINFYKNRITEADNREKGLLQEKKNLKANEKEKLEERFQEVTETLYAKNKELRLQNKEIKRKFDEITIQNKQIIDYHDLLELKNKVALQQKAELEEHVINLEKFIEERTSELQEATLKAEEANMLKTAFLRDFSHEIRTPMNAIAGFSSLLLELEIDDKSHDYYVDIINVHTDNLLELIDNIVDLSRIQTNQLHLKNVKFDPAKMYIALLDMFNAKLKREKKSFISLIVDLPTDREIRLYLDYNRFWKIVYQLVDNSIKYTESGFINFGYQKKENGSLEVFVIDTGVGIKKEKLAVVFDSFRKVEKDSTKLHGGAGMGLSLVKGLVALMNGKIEITSSTLDDYSEKEPGTTIRIEIPNAFV